MERYLSRWRLLRGDVSRDLTPCIAIQKSPQTPSVLAWGEVVAEFNSAKELSLHDIYSVSILFLRLFFREVLEPRCRFRHLEPKEGYFLVFQKPLEKKGVEKTQKWN